MALGSVGQEDFSGGFCRSVPRERIPSNGLYDCVNGLLDDDGTVYKRGGSAWQSEALGSAGLLAVWDGQLVGGARTVLVGASASPGFLGVLNADDSAVVQVASPASTAVWLSAPTRPFALGGYLVVPRAVRYAGLTYALAYAGSRKTSANAVGTATATNGSATVTGVGTSWLTTADPGIFFEILAKGLAVKSVDSNTQLTLERPWPHATAVGSPYLLQPVVLRPETTTFAQGAAGTVSGRLVYADGPKVRFTGSFRAGGLGWDAFSATDYHEPGGDILGLAGLRNLLFVFTSDGISVISGMDNDLVDDFGNVQQRVERINDSIVLWRDSGLATWDDRLVVPALNGVWLIGTSGAPVDLSRSIAPYYKSYTALDYRPGQAAVYRQHYFLPMLNSSNVVIEVLVCRLDKPYRGVDGSTWFPWVRLGAAGAGNMAAFATRRRSTGTPRLLGAHAGAGSRVWNLTGFFSPAAGNNTDADGATVASTVSTRFFRTGRLHKKNLVRRARVRKELVDAWADNPIVAVTFDHPEGTVSLGSLPESDGTASESLPVGERALHGGLTLTQSGAAASHKLSSVELLVRPTGKT